MATLSLGRLRIELSLKPKTRPAPELRCLYLDVDLKQRPWISDGIAADLKRQHIDLAQLKERRIRRLLIAQGWTPPPEDNDAKAQPNDA